MITKSINSTQAQNNFGQVLDDVTRHQTRYIVNRRGVPEVIILSLDDFARALSDEGTRQYLNSMVNDLRPKYALGEILDNGESVLEGNHDGDR
ncbi:MAG: type II toxin-antitoxin system Phd/YefM family antitoxin [Anaerolineae bacterium]|nr:type II toxin-antitoxin system Phd/YefM family antitoxin [Anaerolineae bacterium]